MLAATEDKNYVATLLLFHTPVLEFENAPHCGRRMRKREVATQL